MEHFSLFEWIKSARRDEPMKTTEFVETVKKEIQETEIKKQQTTVTEE
jgi:hypothetical protein